MQHFIYRMKTSGKNDKNEIDGATKQKKAEGCVFRFFAVAGIGIQSELRHPLDKRE